MKALVVYDSAYGNTEKIARAIAGALADEVRLLRAAEASPGELEGASLLIVGSPTQGGRATPAVQEFLNKIPKDALKNISVAVFDTRVKAVIAKVFGYAAGRIASGLKEKGGSLTAPPEGFFVKGTEGPLVDGELQRAASWAKGIAESRQ